MASMYGCAHSSIVGFISTMWVSQSPDNSVLDGAPSPITGTSRKGQRNADILLCRGDNPCIVVEVETSVEKYEQKLDSVLTYLRNVDGLEFGLIVMTNLCEGKSKYKHNWEPIKQKISSDAKECSIALVSVEKENIRSKLSKSNLDKLRKRNDYYPWRVKNVDYWVHDRNGVIREGNLWRR